MYTHNLITGIVTRDSDGAVVSPVIDAEDPLFIEYNTWASLGNNPTLINNDPKLLAQKEIWDQIKVIRDRKKTAGVKVGDFWFHSDPDSRTQQLALFTASAYIPEGLMWKTLTPGGGLYAPVEVPMTPQLATAIFLTTMQHDNIFYAAGEAHRISMLTLENPYDYDYNSGWPLSFEDVS